MNTLKSSFFKYFLNKKNSNSLSLNKSLSLPSTPTPPTQFNNLRSLKIKTTKDVSNDNDEILMEPYNYLLAHPGKEIRTKMIEAFDYWLKVPKDQLNIITKVVEMLHNASLL